jgi:hypothetical protein
MHVLPYMRNPSMPRSFAVAVLVPGLACAAATAACSHEQAQQGANQPSEQATATPQASQGYAYEPNGAETNMQSPQGPQQRQQPPPQYGQPPAYGQVGATEEQGPDAIPLPPGSTVVTSTAMTDIRAFPEEVQKGVQAEGAVGVQGVDRIYQNRSSYEDTVNFFDRNLSGSGFTNIRRTTSSQNATTWSAQTADGKPIRVAVRNTNPTSIEVLAVTASAASFEEQGGAPQHKP